MLGTILIIISIDWLRKSVYVASTLEKYLYFKKLTYHKTSTKKSTIEFLCDLSNTLLCLQNLNSFTFLAPKIPWWSENPESVILDWKTFSVESVRLWSIREEVLHVAHEGHFGSRISTYWYLNCLLDYNPDFTWTNRIVLGNLWHFWYMRSVFYYIKLSERFRTVYYLLYGTKMVEKIIVWCLNLSCFYHF